MWFLTHAWLIPALMGLSFVLTLAFGKRLGPSKAHLIGLPAVLVCFVLALCIAGAWVSHNDDHVTDTAAAMANVDPSCSRVAAAAQSGDVIPGQADTAHMGGHDASADMSGTEGGESGAESESLSRPVVRCTTWWENGSADAVNTGKPSAVNALQRFTVGTMVDGPSVLMLVVVTLVSAMAHLFSTDYVKGDRRYTHYFAFLSLFTASMLFFVLAENTLQMIVGWELVGMCSYALIGHWWEERPNSDAANKAFFTNRVGDVGLLIGMILLFFGAGQSFNVIDVNTAANGGGMSHTLLLVAACCLIAAVMSKSGQFILHTWLPDAMAGPTPVSALIHAATMVVAGIYMVARLYPVFFHGLSIAGSSVNLLAVVGSVTAVLGALLAFVQKDIKKVLAYSTISQLGFMVAALGVGAWTAAMFHLFTHAFFKACLFLGAGSLSHACHHSFDMVDDMGGLRKVMPKTFWTFLVASGALAGIFPLAGFWSKDEILAGTGGVNTGVGTYYFALVLLLIGAFCTAAYMTRVIWYVFYGEYRGHGHPHEGGSRMTVPLIVLATLGAVAGFANFPRTFFGWTTPAWLAQRFEHLVEPVGIYFPGHAGGFTHAGFNGLLAVFSLLVALGGVGLVYLFYWKRSLPVLENLTERNRYARFAKTVLENKYYLDWLYTDVIVGFVKGGLARATYWVNQNLIDGVVNGAGRSAVRSGRFVYDRLDQGIVDGTVNGVAALASATGGELRRTQTGRIQQYATLFFAAAALLAGVLVVVIG